MSATIQEMGKECRRLADKGAKFNIGEAALFHRSIQTGDLAQCEALIRTLKERTK